MPILLKIILNTAGVILAAAVAIAACIGVILVDMSSSHGAGGNPYSRILFSKEAKATVRGVRRIDDEGRLYYMDFTAKYDTPIARFLFSRFSSVTDFGCSSFRASNGAGDVLHCRNYDVPHKNPEGGMTGLNVVVHCNEKGCYETLAVADACWFSQIGFDYYAGSLDNGETNLTPLALLPFFCMDGMNERGLAASILALDIKEGEHAVCQAAGGGLQTVNISVMLRYILDRCATVEEAYELASRYNMTNTFANDYHIFLTDSEGNSGVLEWRHNTLTLTYTDAATNFYCGYDDAEDNYYGGSLKESFPGPADAEKEYRYGYGHGYGRFNTIVTSLDALDKNNTLTEEEAFSILAAVAQDYDGGLTSYTQYSVIYNTPELTADICIAQDFEHIRSFSCKQIYAS